MQLNLKNPIVFFDLETTGINIANDRIVEISILKIDTDGNEEVKTMRINPEVPIPAKTSAIHGIYDEDVKDAPTFKEVGRQLATFMEGCDIAGYNSNKFDIPLLAEEFIRAEVDFDMTKRKFIDVQTIFHKMEKRTLEAAYKFYCDKNLDDAHSAEADTRATYEVLKAQLDRYSDLKNDMEWLSKFSAHNKNADFAGRIIFNDKGVEVFNFGKYKGKPVTEVLDTDPGYYGWMMNGDFPLFTKKVLTNIKLRNAFGKG
ncbi:3'-5' exonuclease [Marinilabilia salmonicolor]|jgi:DNA polymerase-3 subunit epsilon|uniref:DNA polymerase-3 subunit epsilon n=1 Tax=Marinilabilia salmonicolor TaxID=989 RepID=A0A368UJY6_9BACT|nr:3'-5' exonuclease [Marinilabilia salmonicolor]RCW28986.1 DNA polymerase-3 subunit epsilon [Marinilabilia salmonicolor]